ncbi:hypothetical protein R5H57_002049, partial [Enterococcus faecium]|nr:hypothetical protein [Enterococcus faecium]
GNGMDKYKKQLKEITTETKLSNNEFQNKVVDKILKDANVKIKDKNFENALSTSKVICAHSL